MSERGTDLKRRVDRQMDDIAAAFANLGEADLTKPDLKRKGRTVADAAAHIAEGYHFLVRFLWSAGYVPGGSAGGHGHERPTALSLPELRQRLDDGRIEISVIADLTDQQLDSVPPPKSSRFSDGRRSLELAIEEVIAHQTQHLTDLKTAVAE